MARPTLLASLAAAALLSTHAAAQSVPADARYVMSFFKANGGGGDEKLYIATSPDALTWTTLNGGNPVWAPPGAAEFLNVVRDPSIIYHDGWYWVAFTSGNYGNHAAFGLVKSQDFVNWTYLGNVPLELPGQTDQLTWNPCFFRDGDGTVYLFISISPDSGSTYNPIPKLRTYVTQPTNAAWTQWATPQQLSLPGSNTNEFYCWKEGATYHGIYVDFPAAGSWKHTTSTNLLTGWTPAQELNYFNGKEGGMMLKKPGGGYRFYYEAGNGAPVRGYHTSDCSDTFTSFTAGTPVVTDTLMRNGKMTLLEGHTSFATWAAANAAAAPGALADPDGDGLPNLLEAALALPPLTPRVGPAPFLSGSQLAIRHRRVRAFAGLQIFPELAATLGAWSTATPISATLMTDGSELVETRHPGGSSQFLRVKATLQP